MTEADAGSSSVSKELGVLDEATCWERLASKRVGRLAVLVNDRVDVFPVNYKLASGSIVFRTEEGSKLTGAMLGPNVAFEVDDIDEEGEAGWSVVAHGGAEEVKSLADLVALETFTLESWAGQQQRLVRIRVKDITGREITAPPPQTRATPATG